MQDNAGGFRTYWPELVGTVTCWPSLLSMAATWDRALVGEFATALGREFAAKGANAILGPSINVHRVARGGRNFEYLSGDDPYLGAALAVPYVEGVQGSGVMAVMKHFAFNQQETGRSSGSDSHVDQKVAQELYYPPFEAAVAAGVSGASASAGERTRTLRISPRAANVPTSISGSSSVQLQQGQRHAGVQQRRPAHDGPQGAHGLPRLCTE